MDQSNKYHIHLEKKNGWFDINLKEVWQYRDLIWLFTKRTFVLRYKQTILGPLWVILQPLMTTLIFTLVFGGIAGISTDGVPQVLFYMGGNAVWSFFAACLNGTATTFTGNANVFGKVYFPRLVSPISTVLSSMINFLIQLGMFLCFWVYYLAVGEVSPNYVGILMLPVVMAYLGLLGLGFGVIVSSLTTKYRDLTMLVGFGVSLWMYITPVVFPVSTLGNGGLYHLVMLNPVTCAVETFRWAFLGQGVFDPLNWGISTAVMAVVVCVGVIIFSKVEKTFMDTV
jgi:lipopolysaccharide transport system permease protein